MSTDFILEGKRQRAVAAKDSRDHGQAHAMLLTFFPSIPDDACKEILEHGFQKGSGRVGRSKKIEDRLKVQLAVNAHIRHRLTPYDSILAANRGQYDKLAARDMVYSQVEEIADSWRATSIQPQISQIPRRQTTGSNGSAATLDANRRRRVRRSKKQLPSPDEAQSLGEAFGGLRLMENQFETVARVEAARRLSQKVARKVACKDRLQDTTRDVRQPQLDLSVKSTKEGKRRVGKGKRSQEGQRRGHSIPPKPAKREEYRRLITARGAELEPRRIDTDVPKFEPSHDEPRTTRLLRSNYRTAASTPEGSRDLSNMPGNGVPLEARMRDTYVPTYGLKPSIEAPRQSHYPLRSSHRTSSGVHAKNDASEGTTEEPSANPRTVVEELEWMDIDEIIYEDC